MRRIRSGLGHSRTRVASRRPTTRFSLERLEERTLLSTATFLGQDTTTQGNWIGKYGSQGYDVIGSSASLPSYATVTPSGQSNWTWASSTTDSRALQNPGGSGRIAACWYSGSSFQVDLNLSDGQSQDLALYLLDWDNLGRAEQVQISDPATGAVLSTQSISSFQNGVYLDYAVSGNLMITITAQQGVNAVLSGLFLDPPVNSGATFLGQDTATQGNWIGRYGSQGYDVIGDSASLPSYATVTPSSQNAYTWASSTTDPRALQNPGGSGSLAACWYSGSSFQVNLNLIDGQTHDLALYLLDWDNLGRAEQVQITSAATGAVLSTQAISSFNSGVYLNYAVSGDVVITITCQTGINAVLSGLFLDPSTGRLPVVIGDTPGAGAAGVPTIAAPTATFNEPVQASSINAKDFVLTAPSGASVAGTVSYNSTTNIATLTPSAPLAGSTTYTATVSGVTNSLGGAMSIPFAWSFTTAPSPAVIAQSPAPGATGVATTTTATATFNRAIQANTIAFSLRDSSGQVIPATVSYNPSNFEVTITPTAPLSDLTTYTATLNGVEDTLGDPMVAPVSWSFTTNAYIATAYNNIPDFGANPTVVSIASGSWSNPSTWSTGQVPGVGAVVSIATGTTVTYDVNSTTVLNTIAIQSGGTLQFATNINTEVIAANYLVKPGGTLDVGTQANPIASNVHAWILTADQPLNTTFDPQQYGDSLIGLGNVTMYGAYKTPFAQLATEPHAGDTTLTFASPVVGWQPGDSLFLPDTRQAIPSLPGYQPEMEYASISSISPNGLTVTLTAPLQFDHLGARDASGSLRYLPQVANETRNVVVRSQNQAGNRGIVMFLQNANVSINSGAFLGLGRTTSGPIDNTTFDANGNVTHIGTNEQDRTPVQFMNLWGPTTPQPDGYQYTFADNVVHCIMENQDHVWGIEVNNSSYGLIQGNVVDNWNGAGISLVTGAEVHNRIEGNFVTQINGTGGRTTTGLDGIGYWSRTPDNAFVNNVATDINPGGTYSYGYDINLEYVGSNGVVTVPAYQGADPALAGQGTSLNVNDIPLWQFSGDEVYGATPNGLSLWWLGTFGMTNEGVAGTVKNLVAWHLSGWGYFGYPADALTIEGFVDLGDLSVNDNGSTGIWFADYNQTSVVITNADIEGENTGIVSPYVAFGETLIENSYLRDVVDVLDSTTNHTGDPTNLPARSLVLQNDTFAAPAGSPLIAIDMAYETLGLGSAGECNLVAPDQVFVYNYNGVTGDNFQVYYNQQAASFVVPQTGSLYPGLVGSPAAGLTNQQNWSQYGIAIAGAVAPSNAISMAGIVGLVVPMSTPSTSSIATVGPSPSSSVSSSTASATFTVAGTPALVEAAPAGDSSSSASAIALPSKVSPSGTGVARSVSGSTLVVMTQPVAPPRRPNQASSVLTKKATPVVIV